MIDIVINEMRADAPFDFGDRAFIPLLREEGWAIAQDKDTWAFPPIETLFVQRKVSGTALLGARLKAKVNIRRMVEEVLASTSPRPVGRSPLGGPVRKHPAASVIGGDLRDAEVRVDARGTPDGLPLAGGHAEKVHMALAIGGLEVHQEGPLRLQRRLRRKGSLWHGKVLRNRSPTRHPPSPPSQWDVIMNASA